MANEALTEKEVEAIIKRYGESQTGAGQTSVEDVAEALQVEAGVVEKLLHEVRTAESSKQLQDRLSALEKENAQLKSRSSHWQDEAYGFEGWGFPTRRRRRALRASMIGMAAGAILLAFNSGSVSQYTVLGLIAILALLAMRYGRTR